MEKDIITSSDNTGSLRDIYENSFVNKSNNNINNKLKSNKESKESTKTDSFNVEELKNYYPNHGIRTYQEFFTKPTRNYRKL